MPEEQKVDTPYKECDKILMNIRGIMGYKGEDKELQFNALCGCLYRLCEIVAIRVADDNELKGIIEKVE